MDKLWTDWKPLPNWRPDFASLLETLDGGQAFRWNREEKHAFSGIIGKRMVRLRWSPPNFLHWSAAPQIGGTTLDLETYFGTRESYKILYDALPWRSDPHLRRCVSAFPQLRILRQDPEETLLCFLCSATKQIVQIKTMLGILADRFGSPLPGGMKSLPSWAQLPGIPESALRACKIGFRARNIKGTAEVLAQHRDFLPLVGRLPYGEARMKLCQLPGVGEKIADCVLLFGFNRLEAFPVDTWILKAMRRHYKLGNVSPRQAARFGRNHFGKSAGLAQQFLFAWERKHSRRPHRQT